MRTLLVTGSLIGACSGVDPKAFQNEQPDGDRAEAGWSFDAGVPSQGGAGGSGASSGDAGPGARSGASGGRASAGGSSGTPGGAQGGAASAGRSAGGAGSGSSGVGGRSGDETGGSAGTGAGGIAGGEGGGPGEPVHALFFSEYVEGSSSYKALEIAAERDSTLSGCRLVTYFNGSSSGSGVALDGSVPAHTVYVLCSSQLAELLGALCDRATNLSFNGDDALALECGGKTLDVIGQIGVDPGDAWGAGDTSTLNRTLRRRCESPADPDGSDAFDPARDWAGLPTDTFDGLGDPECADSDGGGAGGAGGTPG